VASIAGPASSRKWALATGKLPAAVWGKVWSYRTFLSLCFSAKLTGHDSWTKTYDNPEIYKWLFSHKRAKDE